MKARIRKGRLVITLPMHDPRPSTSGKSLVVAGTNGVRRSALKVSGQPLFYVASAFIRSSAKPESRPKNQARAVKAETAVRQQGTTRVRQRKSETSAMRSQE
jgi:hypothetical protein